MTQVQLHNHAVERDVEILILGRKTREEKGTKTELPRPWLCDAGGVREVHILSFEDPVSFL